jgi:hypothetical protein
MAKEPENAADAGQRHMRSAKQIADPTERFERQEQSK